MQRTKTIAAVALILLAVGAGRPAPVEAAGSPGDAGMLFLRLGVGAREAAMGGTGVASTEGAAAAYWNPSRLALQETGTSLLLQHHSWLGLFDHEAAALTHDAGVGLIGFTFQRLGNRDEIPRYDADENVGVPLGSFDAYDLAVGASFSRPIGEAFAVGLQAKVLYEKIDIYSDTGWAVDLFATYASPVIPGLIFAGSATNLGGQMQLDDAPYDLPQTVTVGVGYAPRTGMLADRVSLAGDVAFLNDSNEKAHVGGEFKLVPELALRVGYKVNYDSQGLTAGAGFRYKQIGLDYAWEEVSPDGLDPGHKFALELRF